jgi:RHS repeat-associated protein
MTVRHLLRHCAVLLFLAAAQDSDAQVQVTLVSSAAPSAGEPGVTNVSVTGSGFPTGTIPPGNVLVKLTPSGGGSVTTSATAVTTIVGTTRRVSFMIPAGVAVAGPTAYNVSLSGTTTTGAAFASSNTASLTINPAATLISVTPNTAMQGQTLTVSIVGSYSNFLQGSSQVSFAGGITVGSAMVADSTHLTANITIQNNAPVGPQAVTVKTGIEQASLANGFVVQGIPVITQISPGQAQQGQQNLTVAITGQYTHWNQGTTTANFGAGMTVVSLTINSPTSASAVLNVDQAAGTGQRNVTFTTGNEVATLNGGFTVTPGTPALLTALPNEGQQGQQTLSVVLTGQYTHFVQGTTTASFGTGVTVAALTVSSPTALTALLNIDPAAGVGVRDISLTTNAESVTLTGGFIVLPGTPVLLTLSPTYGQQAQQSVPVTITGQYTHFTNSSTIGLGAGIAASNIVAADATHLSADLMITGTAANYASTIVADQPIAYYRLDEPGGAMIAVDSSGTGKDGAYQGTPMLGSPGLIMGPDTAVALNGAGSVSIPDASTVNFVNQPFTIEAWVSGFATSGTAARRLFDKSGVGTANGYALEMNADGIRLVGSTSFAVATPLSTNATYHVVAASDGAGDASIYVNGVLAGSGPYGAAQPYTGPALIGSASDGTLPWLGTVDELAVYKTALSAQQILNHYQAGSTSRDLTVSTGTEVVALANAFSVVPAPALFSLTPSTGQQGVSNLSVNIRGQFTHFAQGITTANFGPGISVVSLTVNNPASATVALNIDPGAMPATTNTVTLTSNMETVTLPNGFTIKPGTPRLLSAMPNVGQQGQQGLTVALTGQYTHWLQGTTTADFGPGVSVTSFVVNSLTSATAVLSIAATANIGQQTITVATGAEVISIGNGFTIQPGTPILTSVTPNQGQQGQQNISVLITGLYTHFVQETTMANLGSGVTIASLTVNSATSATAAINIDPSTAAGARDVILTTNSETATLSSGFTIQPGTPIITQASPNQSQQGQQNVSVAITGKYTHFVQGTTTANFGAGVTVTSVTVNSPTAATAVLNIDVAAATGSRDITVTTGPEMVVATNGFNVLPGGPIITDFSPKSGSVGTVVTVSGTGFVPQAGGVPQITVSKQGGGTLSLPLTNFTSTNISFVIGAGEATGPITVSAGGKNGVSSVPLTIVASSNFTLTTSPSSATLIQGQSVSYAVQVSGANGFSESTQLNVSSLPMGVSANFNPPSITAGQISTLTVTAPANQAPGTSTIAIGGNALVEGIALLQNASAQLVIQAPTTSFIGRTVVSDSVETPLAGVTVTMLGKDGSGNTTGCTGQTTSDAAGNFIMTNLPLSCTGPQLIGYDGTTVTSPAGKYAGVNLIYTLVSGQVTASPVLVHLPRIDDGETFYVTQNSATDQSYSYASIPGLAVTAYAHTTFTMPDGSQPNPFPLVAVHVPVDRLPDLKPPVPTMLNVFIIAFQPANVVASQPVAVYYPNPLNSPPGTDMPLLTLDPTLGKMIPYGTGAVSSDGTQVIPDLDPSHAGHRFGIVHFDWHGPMPSPPMQNNPAPPDSGGDGSGNPGGGSGAGNGNGGNNGGDGDGSGSGDGSGGQGGTGTGTGSGDGGSGGGDSGGGSGCTSPPQQSQLCLTCSAFNEAPASFIPWKPAATSEPEDSHDVADRGSSPSGLSPFVEAERAEAGDPVDMASGIQTFTHVDIAIRGSRGSIPIVRNYRSMTAVSGPFGIGSTHNFNYGLDTAFPTLSPGINLIMPDGNRFLFAARVCPHVIIQGMPFQCPLGLTNLNVPALAGASLTVNTNNSADLRWKDGTVYHFSPISFQIGSLLTSIRDPNGNTTTIARDASGNITTITDPVGRQLTFTYDGSNRITSIADPTGRTAKYTYNAQGSLATFTNPAGGTTQYTYDSNANLLTLTDPRGIVQIQNTLDASGRVVKQVRSDGGTLTFSYVVLNPIATVSPILSSQVTDSNGVQTSYRFNVDGFLTDIVSTQGQTKHIVRQDGTNLRSGAIIASARWSYTYDPNGNLLSRTDPTGLTTAFTYDPVFNKLTSIVDPLGNATAISYDTKGNPLTITDANGNKTTYKYDPTGLLTQVSDALGSTTKFGYDSLGNQSSKTDALGYVTNYSYDGLSRLTQTTDALGRRTVFAYDPLGRLLTRTDAKGGVTTFTYDGDSNLISIKDAKGKVNAFSYDPMNRLQARTDPLGKSDMRTWDTNGDLVQYVDRRGQTSNFHYDNLNRLVTETYSDATVTRNYDFYGRLSQVSDSLSGVFTFTRDLAGRLLSSSTPFGSVDYTYDVRGMMASRQVAGETLLSYSYDPVGNLTASSMTSASAAFMYDPRNALSSITRMNGVISTFAYDPAGRLTSITHSQGSTVIDSETYGYDAVGNRNSHSTAISQALITPATINTYNAANQLTSFGSASNTYDANGNIAQDGAVSNAYTWDGRNRLKSITTISGQTTTFTYDFTGQLIQQADAGPMLNLTKNFILDNLTNVASETASDGSSYSTLVAKGMDSHLAVILSNGQVQYGLSDAINSTVATTDQSGKIIAPYFYEAFGLTTTMGTYPFQFTGRTPIVGSLYYNRARFYNSQTGRFVSEDPLGFAGSDVNLYWYARNHPGQVTDPAGLAAGGGYYNCVEQCITDVNPLPVTVGCTYGSVMNPPVVGTGCGIGTAITATGCLVLCANQPSPPDTSTSPTSTSTGPPYTGPVLSCGGTVTGQ